MTRDRRDSTQTGVLRFTIEANALEPMGARWRPAIAELLMLARDYPDIDVARTPGARRERARRQGDPDAARREALMREVPALTETFTLDASLLDDRESLLGDVDVLDHMAVVVCALWGSRRPKATSDVEDAFHVATHRAHGRDVFVTTDQRLLAHADALRATGVIVTTPEQAVEMARSKCASVASRGAGTG